MKKPIDVVAAVIEKNDRVFVARRRPGTHLEGYWEFPGGKVEHGETPEKCLSRELQEELCITVEITRYIGESVYDYGTKLVRLMAYQADYLDGKLQLIDHDQARWLAVHELGSVNWAPADIPIVEMYRTLISIN